MARTSKKINVMHALEDNALFYVYNLFGHTIHDTITADSYIIDGS